MRLVIALCLTAAFTHALNAAQPAAEDPYDRTLAAEGIKPTPAGILAYLRPYGEKELRQLIGQLGDPDYNKRQEAMQRLSRLPVILSDALHTALASKDLEVRYRAEIVLKRNRQQRNSDVLLAVLKKMNGREFEDLAPLLLDLLPQLQRKDLILAAKEALRNIAQPKHIPRFRKTLKESSHPELRKTIILTLARFGGKEVVADLRHALSDSDEQIQLSAAVALLRLKRREGLKTLAGLLKSDNVEIRADAAAALRASTGKNFGFLAIDRSPARQEAAEAWVAWVRDKSASARLLDIPRGQVLTNLSDQLQAEEIIRITGHQSTVYGAAFSPDGKSLVTGSGDQMLKRWLIANGTLQWAQKAHEATVRSVDFSADGKIVASASYDSTIKLWDAKTGKLLNTLKGHTRSVQYLAFSPDNRYLASGASDYAVRIWDVKTGKTVHVLEAKKNSLGRVTSPGHSMIVRAVAFSPDSNTLASCSSDKTIRLWDVETGKHLKVLVGHTSSVRGVVFSPDGRSLASASLDNTVRLWDVASGAERVTFRGHRLSVKAVAFVLNGRLLASAGNDRTVIIWDTSAGKQVKTLTGPGSSIWHLTASRDGRLIAACGSDRTAHVWELHHIDAPATKEPVRPKVEAPKPEK